MRHTDYERARIDAAPAGMRVGASGRNFFPAGTRWRFTGIRLAR